MTDSGSSNISSRPPFPESLRAGKSASEPNARLLGIPSNLSNVSHKSVLRGDIVKVDRNGKAEIKTDQGTIEVQLPKDAKSYSQGKAVEIVLRPGQNGQTSDRVEIRENKQTKDPPPAQTRTSKTPVEINVQKDIRPLPVTIKEEQVVKIKTDNAPLPPPGTEVRLEPLTPYQAQKLNAVKTPTLITSELPLQIIENANTLATLTAENIQDALTMQIAELKPPITQLLEDTPLTNPIQTKVLPIFEEIKPEVLTPTLKPINIAFLKEPLLFNTSTEQELTNPPQIRLQISSAITEKAEIGSFSIVAPKSKPEMLFAIDKTNLLSPKSSSDIPALIASKASPKTIAAVITGHTKNNQPILSLLTSDKTARPPMFLMHTAANEAPPIGSQILLSPQMSNNSASLTPINPDAQILPTQTPLPSFFTTPEPWPLMEEIFQTLAKASPQSAQAMLNVTPSPSNPAQLGSTAMLFLAAVRGGDLTQWLSTKAIDILRRTDKGNKLLQRLGKEGQTIGRMESKGGEWRSTSLPMYWEGEINKMALHYKQEQNSGDNEGQERGKQTRFVFDLNLSHMGAVQLDGLLRARRLDLIVRTQETFSTPMQMHMKQIYTKAMEQTELNGELSFQDKPESWVTVQVKDDVAKIDT